MNKKLGYQNDIDKVSSGDYMICAQVVIDLTYLVGCLVGRLVVGLLEGNGVVGA